MRGHFSAAICLLTGACLLNRGWMLIVLMTSQSPRVQRARSLKQAERHSGSQRNPESLRNLSDTTLLHAKTWCIRTAEKGFLTCLCNSGSPGAQMKTVFQVLRVAGYTMLHNAGFLLPCLRPDVPLDPGDQEPKIACLPEIRSLFLTQEPQKPPESLSESGSFR